MQMQEAEAAKHTSLPDLWQVRSRHGPPLPVPEQLRWPQQSEVLPALPFLGHHSYGICTHHASAKPSEAPR